VTSLIAIDASAASPARTLADRLGITDVAVPEIRTFPDGELYVRLDRDAVDADVVLVGNLVGDSFLRAAFLADLVRDLGAARVGIVAPYLAYMRQDSRFQRGEAVTAQCFGKLVSSVADWLVTVDPHLHRYESLARVYSIPTTIARAAPAIAQWVASEVDQPVLVGPDAESRQWVAAVAEQCGAPYVILEKTRRGDRDVTVSSPARTWNGHTPVVIDDIVSTGRTMLEATRVLRAAGSAPPMCVAIHAVFADAVCDELAAAGARGIVTCDTIPHATNKIAVADSIASAVREQLT
jgi:ribose-phosphate pyrophosphokinase